MPKQKSNPPETTPADGSPALQAFKVEVDEKLAEAGCSTLEEWAEKHPGKHLPATYGSYPSCALCGKVQPNTGVYRSVCKGIAKVVLRGQREHGKTIRMVREACDLARGADHTHVHDVALPKGIDFQRVLSFLGSMRREEAIGPEDVVSHKGKVTTVRFKGAGVLRLGWG
jgi:hypothetical protein